MDGTSDSSGCLNQFIMLVMSLMLGVGIFTGAPSEVNPPPEESTITLSPMDESLPFELEGQRVSLRHRSTLERPCHYAIQGYAFDMEGNTFTDYDVYVSVAGEAAEKAGTYLDGSWNYGGLLQWEAPVDVWMTLKDSDERVSPVVTIPSRDCTYNLVVINFAQVMPLVADAN